MSLFRLLFLCISSLQVPVVVPALAFSSSSSLKPTSAVSNNRGVSAATTTVTMAATSTMTTSTIIKDELLKRGLYIRTPLIRSEPMTKLCDNKCEVYLKLDCLQPSGSFKDRGMANLCYTYYTQNGIRKLIASSGGNAGLAVATVGPKMNNMSVKVVVPQSTKPNVIHKLQNQLNANVTIHGKIWNEADELARKLVEEDSEAAYVSPYDNHLLWTGHSTLVDEIVEDLNCRKLHSIVLSVGGGGLLCGVLEGLERHSVTCQKTNVVACETKGADSFGQSWNKITASLSESEQQEELHHFEPVRLNGITSIATSLGALEVTKEALIRSLKHGSGGGKVNSCICTDEEAIMACYQFVNDHRILVEPACGAALAAIYSDRLRSNLLLSSIESSEEIPIIVVEVCGGSGVNMDLLQMWKTQFLSKQQQEEEHET